MEAITGCLAMERLGILHHESRLGLPMLDSIAGPLEWVLDELEFDFVMDVRPVVTIRERFHCQDEGIGIQTQCSEYSVPYKLTVLFWVVQSADSGISVLLVLQLHAMGWGYKCENLEINKGTSCLAFIYPLGSDCITWLADHWCLRHLLVDGTTLFRGEKD